MGAENEMIYITLRGNLGNQMFIYAFAQGLASKYPEQQVVLLTYLLDATDIKYALDCFKLNNEIRISKEFYPPWYANERNIGIRILRKFVPNILYTIGSLKRVYIWKNHTEKVFSDLSHGSSFFSGYWQSEKYFRDCIKEILKDFEITKPFSDAHDQYKGIIRNSTNSVCVSYRRGDYLSQKNQKIYGVCDTQYYKKAYEELERRIKEYTIFVFSDDINWCKQNIHSQSKIFFEPLGLEVWETFDLMASCNHFIISNSSFAWWAQYIGKKEDTLVFAPDKWYKKQIKCEIYQNDWIKV